MVKSRVFCQNISINPSCSTCCDTRKMGETGGMGKSMGNVGSVVQMTSGNGKLGVENEVNGLQFDFGGKIRAGHWEWRVKADR